MFLFFYTIFFLVDFLALKESCSNSKIVPDCTNSTGLFESRETFKTEVKQYKKTHETISTILTFFMAFYVAAMMNRWWGQVSSMPDTTQVAMVLNCLVKSEEDSEENSKRLKLKKNILRYCLLSYHAVMIQLSKRETITFNWTCCCSRSTEEDKNVNEDPKSYFSEDTDQFNIKNSRHWTVPINYACILVRDSKLIKDTKDVMAAIIKFQQSLGNLLQFHDNPFPPLCIIVVDVVFWGYILLGTFSLQHCYEPSDNFVLGVIYVSSKLLLCNG